LQDEHLPMTFGRKLSRPIIVGLLLLLVMGTTILLLWGVGGPGGSRGGASFVGVIDEEPTVNHFFGLVAGSASLAASNIKAADLCNATGCSGANLCSGVKVLSTGQLDVSNGLYCNGGTETVAAWCPANCTSGGTGRVSALYDQLNQRITASAGSYAVAPDFILSGVNGKPTWGCVSSRNTVLNATITPISAPRSYGITIERNANFTNPGYGVSDAGATFALGNAGTANTGEANYFGAAGLTASMKDGSGPADFSHLHAMLFTIPSSPTTADLYIDGNSPTTAPLLFVGDSGTTFQICSNNTNYADAFMTRVWSDNTFVDSTTAKAVTNLLTVPLP
jgi:hypothetical protein